MDMEVLKKKFDQSELIGQKVMIEGITYEIVAHDGNNITLDRNLKFYDTNKVKQKEVSVKDIIV